MIQPNVNYNYKQLLLHYQLIEVRKKIKFCEYSFRFLNYLEKQLFLFSAWRNF